MSIEWSPAIAVGHATIDEQHRQLLRHFNDLLEACRKKEGKQELQTLFTFLQNYTQTHFREEEGIMESCSYPDLGTHRKAHREFEKRLQELQDTMRERGPSLAVIVETNQALLKWIVFHIKNIDVVMGRFLQERQPS